VNQVNDMGLLIRFFFGPWEAGISNLRRVLARDGRRRSSLVAEKPGLTKLEAKGRLELRLRRQQLRPQFM